MDKGEVKGVIMSALFVSGEPVELAVFARLLNCSMDYIEDVVGVLIEERADDGISVTRIEDKVQLCTNKKYAQYIKELFAPPAGETLSASMLETLSIIAYKQPVTRAEIDKIRGVQSNYAVSVLVDKGLVYEAGRKDVLGRPALLATTEEFLRHFGISSLNELPAIDFETAEDREAGEEEEVDQA